MKNYKDLIFIFSLSMSVVVLMVVFNWFENVLLKYLLTVFLVSGSISTYTYLYHILPALSSKRKVYWSEWLFDLNYNMFSYLDEYKIYCNDNYLPLTLHRFLWGLFWFNVVNVAVCFFISMAM